IFGAIARFGVKRLTDAGIIIASTGRPSLVDFDQELGHRPLKNRMISMVCDLAPLDRPAVAGQSSAIREMLAFDDRIESFWQQAAQPFDFVAVPPADWLNWRYCDARGGIGSVLLAEDDAELLGFV